MSRIETRGGTSAIMAGLLVAAAMLLALFSAPAALANKSAAKTAECKPPRIEYGRENCETEKEHANYYDSDCPLNFKEYTAEEFGAKYNLAACDWASSYYEEKWKNKAQKEQWEKQKGRPAPDLQSQFHAGNVTVALKLPIELRGGAAASEENEAEFRWVAPEPGDVETIQPEAQPAPPLNDDINTALLSESERERYTYELDVAKAKKTTATVELAGPASGIIVNIENLLEGEGIAFHFPVKVKLTNPFLGPECYVGSNTTRLT